MNGAPTVLSNNLILYSSSYFENTAKVVVPSAALPHGKIVVHLGQPRSSAGFISRDLVDAANDFAVNAAAVKFPYPLDPTTQINATDNQLIRLQDGSLLASKNGYIWSDLSPKPAWFDTGSFQYGTNLFSPRARNAVYIFRSTDGGLTWLLWSYIDSAAIEDGKYGWPQPNTGPTGFGIGGFDRTELYQDPWTGDIFVSGHGDGGPYTVNNKTTSNHAGVIFRSQDDGVTWQTFHVFEDPPNQSKGAAPYEMTSTPDHNLVVFHIESSKPTLYFVENGTMSGPQTVIASDGGNPLKFGTATDVDDIRGSQPCVARIGKKGSNDSVWIAYPSLNSSKQQTYVIAVVTFEGSSAPVVDLVANVTAEDPQKASAVMGAFLYDDFVEPDHTNQAPTVLFYWIDAPPKTNPAPANQLIARYQVFYMGGSFPAGYLSVNGGLKRYFNRLGIGDYFSGGFFWMNNKLNFLCQWAETNGIKANIVSMPPIPLVLKPPFYAAIDPLALILSNQVYVQLTLPDPPPPDVLRQQIAVTIRGLSIAQRNAVLANLERVRMYVKAFATEMKKFAAGERDG